METTSLQIEDEVSQETVPIPAFREKMNKFYNNFENCCIWIWKGLKYFRMDKFPIIFFIIMLIHIIFALCEHFDVDLNNKLKFQMDHWKKPWTYLTYTLIYRRYFITYAKVFARHYYQIIGISMHVCLKCLI